MHNSRTGVFVGAQVPATSNWRRPLGATEFSIASISVAMEEDETKTATAGRDDVARAAGQHVRRAPSAFANRIEDHFPQDLGIEPGSLPELATR